MYPNDKIENQIEEKYKKYQKIIDPAIWTPDKVHIIWTLT